MKTYNIFLYIHQCSISCCRLADNMDRINVNKELKNRLHMLLYIVPAACKAKNIANSNNQSPYEQHPWRYNTTSNTFGKCSKRYLFVLTKLLIISNNAYWHCVMVMVIKTTYKYSLKLIWNIQD